MKTDQQVEKALTNLLNNRTNYTGMTYEEGIEEALRWFLGEVSDSEFEYASEL